MISIATGKVSFVEPVWGLDFVILSAAAAYGLPSIGPQQTMILLQLMKGSGPPIFEKSSQERRPGYADYCARTSGFFPKPPKQASK